MKKKFFMKLILILTLTVVSILIYKIYIQQNNIRYINKYSEIQINLDNNTKLSNNNINNISIKDENNNNIYAYVFLSTDSKKIMINPPIGGFNQGSTICIKPNNGKKLYFRVKGNTPIKVFKSTGEPKYGDIIGTTDKFMGYQYDHMAIYVGNNKVIHYCSTTGNASDAEIKETDMEPYFNKGNYFILNIKNTTQFNAEDTVKRAKTRLGEKKYNLLQNNCEHFVIWCKTDNSESFQLENLSEEKIIQLKIFTSLGINLQ